MAIGDIPEKVFGLIANVERLQADVDKIADEVRELRDRVKDLEAQGELVAQMAKNASLQATIEVTQRLSKEVGQLEARMSAADRITRD